MRDDTVQQQASSAENRRRPQAGILIRPRQQFRYAFSMVAGGILAQSAATLFVAYLIHSTINGIVDSHTLDPMAGEALKNSFNLALGFLTFLSVAFALLAILVGVKLSHRIYGPMVPFLRHINRLKAGEYEARIKLRMNDDLVEIKDALNDLAQTLEAKSK